MEALFWGPSTLTADPLQSLLDPDEMMASAPEEASSPLSSLSSSSSQFSSPSPPSSPTPLLDDKVGGDLLPLSWAPADQLGHAHMDSSEAKEDAFTGMDWMAEPMDLNDFDLDSFISSCDPDESPSSPEELVSSLDSLEADLPAPTLDTAAPTPATVTVPVSVPEVQAELEIKTEPPSPVPSPSVLPPPSPESTLELGSEVDVCEVKPAPVEAPQVSRIVLSLSPTRIVLLLAPPKQEAGITSTPSCAVNLSGCVSKVPMSSKPYQANSSRTRPYAVPSRTTRPKPSLDPVVVPSAPAVPKARSRVIEKKQRKMEQNKTAATRYRQKKRVEQESLQAECSRLEERNQELAEKADSITKEIQYLKELMEEVRVAKQQKALAQ